MAATLLNEMGIWNPDAIEKQLSHLDSSMVRRAYTRGEYWDERAALVRLSRPATGRRENPAAEFW